MQVSFRTKLPINQSTTYFRRGFTIDVAPASIMSLTFNVGYAQGFVAYLNGQEVVRRLRGHPEFGVRVVGYLDDRQPGGERFEGKEILGGYEAVTQVLGDHRVDQLFLALPMEAHHEMLKILNALEGELLDVRIVPDVLQFVTLRSVVEELEGLPVIGLAQSPITPSRMKSTRCTSTCSCANLRHAARNSLASSFCPTRPYFFSTCNSMGRPWQSQPGT